MQVNHHNYDAYDYQVVIMKQDNPTRIESVSDSLFYIGWSVLGADETSASWKIKQVSLVGSVWKHKFANGNEEYGNIWANRGTYNYY